MRRCRSVAVVSTALLLVLAPLVGRVITASPAGAATVTAPGAISLGDTVSGNITVATAADKYTLTLAAATRAYFEPTAGACNCTWSLTGARGTVFSQTLANGDVGPTALPAGSYVLTLTGTGTSTGTYSFKVSAVADPQTFPIFLGDTISDGVPAPGAGNIESPGANDLYTFNIGGTGRLVYLDEIADACGCSWSLRASNGSLEHGFATQSLSDVGPTWLAPGAYVLTVSGSGHDTGTYSFQLSAVPDPQSFPISIGDTVAQDAPGPGAGNIESPGAVDQYTFSVGASGESVFFELLDNGCGCQWTLKSSSGSLEYGFPAQSMGDVGPTGLPADSYVLTVTGSGHDTGTYSFQLFAVPDPQTFPISLGDTVAPDTPSAGAGNIESPGAIDQYTFTLPSDQRISLQELDDTCGCSWALRSSTGSLEHGFGAQSMNNVDPTALPAGSYVLTVSGSGHDTGTYSFQLSAVPDPQTFPISIGDTVAQDVPSPGAGNIESPGAIDQYTFNATAGSRVAIVGISCDVAMSYVLSAPDGHQVVRDQLCGANDILDLPNQTGPYLLAVSASSSGVGTYSWEILSSASPTTVTLPDAEVFPIAIGDSVSQNVPSTGAGNIEAADSVDDYVFSASAGQTLRLNDPLTAPCCQLYWQVFGPDGSQLGANRFSDSYGQQFTLTESGTYEIEVSGLSGATGTYAFSLTQVPASQTFAMSIGDTITPDTPTTGEGNIEQAGSDDEYAFNGTAGQIVRFNDLNTFPCCTLYWQIYAPDGAVIAQDWLGRTNGTQLSLPTTGQYTIRVNDYYDYYSYLYGTATGTYSFSLTQLPPSQTFAMSIGDTITPDTPLTGEGNIEQPGSDDEYAFNGTAGQVVRFNDLNTLPCCSLYWQIYAPDGTTMAQDWLGDSQGQQLVLPTTGQYTIRINDYYQNYFYGYGYGTATGTYSFSLVSVPASQTFTMSIGDTITPDTPTVGEGNIEQPGSDDEYNFSGSAGQTVRFDDLNTFPCCTLYWQIYAPDGTTLAQNWLGATTGAQFVLPATGQYTIRINDYYAYSGNAESTATGTYSFSLTQVPLLVPAVTAPIATALSSGQNAVWTIGVQNTSAAVLHGATATLHADANGSTAFDAADTAGCTAQSDLSEVCSLPDIPAHSTVLLTVFVPTNGLSTGTQVTGDVHVSLTGIADATGLLGPVTITSCGVECVFAVAAPGVSVSSNPGAPTSALPTKQVLLLPANQSGSAVGPAIPVTLKSLNPSSLNSAADRTLCPTTGTQPRCTGQISVFAGTFTKYVNRGRPVQIQVVAHWNKTPAGALLMSDDSGSPPIQLATCVLNPTTHAYNTPCAKAETVTGSLAMGNLTTHDTILFVGTDPHFARRVSLPTPNAPTSVKATAGTKRATVQWTKPTVTHTALTGYVVTAYVGTVAKKTVSFKSTATTEVITGLVTGTTYTFKVQARNAVGLSYMSLASSPVKVK